MDDEQIKSETISFVKKDTAPKTSGFSDFFRSVSSKKKMKILNEVAKRANAEQREIFKKATLKSKT